MPVPTSINDLSTTAASNSPIGTDAPSSIDDHLQAHAAFIAQLRDGAYTGADAVKLTGNQTVAGTKTFSSAISGSITGNAATATTASNVSRSVTGAGLATGGGALTNDQTITVTKSTQVQAEAGTDDSTAMTPLRTKQAIAAQAPGLVPPPIGHGQTWKSVSRSVNTTYQNTSGRAIVVSCLVYADAPNGSSATVYLAVGTSNPPSTQVAINSSVGVGTATTHPASATGIVPNGSYYKFTGGGVYAPQFMELS